MTKNQKPSQQKRKRVTKLKIYVKKSKNVINLVKKLTNVGTMINNIMPKAFAVTAIINMAELKSHGTVRITNYTQQVCARTVISTIIIERRD